jgi:hypothetical protein
MGAEADDRGTQDAEDTRQPSMPLLGYGEDQLTLWALTTALPKFLAALSDNTPAPAVTVLFRPSFGRNSTRAGGSLRSEFGEFDAIVVAGSAAYLVEAKWSPSAELEDRVVRLRPEQHRRHRVLRWYFDAWTRLIPRDWDTFREAQSSEFRREFPRMTIPSAGTALARNLEFVLTKLSDSPRALLDVLLFTSVTDAPLPDAVDPPEFRLVALRCPSIGGAGFVRIDD